MKAHKHLMILALLILSSHISRAQLKAGEKAPKIAITDWIKNMPASRDLDGKFVIIDFWATWCAPCLESVPHMNNLVTENKFRSNLVFLSLTDENPAKVSRLLTRVPFSSVVATDTNRQTFDDYKVDYVPICIVIDDQDKVQWTGPPAALTNERIDQIIKRQTIDSAADKEPSLPKATTKMYDSLYQQYSIYFQDRELKEYFSMGPVVRQRYGASFSEAGNKGPYNEMIVGDSLIDCLSSFLDVADHQIELPQNLSGACISYCYKSAVRNSKKDVLDTVLHRLHLKYRVADSLMNAIQLEVSDKDLFDSAAPKSIPKVVHSSFSDSYAAIYSTYFSQLIIPIQNKFATVIVLKDSSLFTRRMDMTIKMDNMKSLVESFSAYGIKASMVQKRLPVYRFSKIN